MLPLWCHRWLWVEQFLVLYKVQLMQNFCISQVLLHDSQIQVLVERWSKFLWAEPCGSCRDWVSAGKSSLLLSQVSDPLVPTDFRYQFLSVPSVSLECGTGEIQADAVTRQEAELLWSSGSCGVSVQVCPGAGKTSPHVTGAPESLVMGQMEGIYFHVCNASLKDSDGRNKPNGRTNPVSLCVPISMPE